MAVLIPIPIVGAGEIALKKVTFITQWVPQAQFAGYYVALEQGIYKKYGIDLTILAGGPGRASADLLRDRKADFATLWLSTGIQMRSEGIRVLNIAQMVQRSALMLVAKKKERYPTPQGHGSEKGRALGFRLSDPAQCLFQKIQPGCEDHSAILLRQPLSPGRRGCRFSHVVQRIPHHTQRGY